MPPTTAGRSASNDVDELAAFLSKSQHDEAERRLNAIEPPQDDERGPGNVDELEHFLSKGSSPEGSAPSLWERLKSAWRRNNTSSPGATRSTAGLQPSRTGQFYKPTPLGTFPILDAPAEGVPQLGRGAKHLVTGEGGRMNAASDIIEGGMTTLEPLMVAGALVNPLAVGRALVVGTGAQLASRRAAEALGLSPAAARLTGNVGGLVAPTVAEGGVRLNRRGPIETEPQRSTPIETEPPPAHILEAPMTGGDQVFDAMNPALGHEPLPTGRVQPVDELAAFLEDPREQRVATESPSRPPTPPTDVEALDRMRDKMATGEPVGSQAGRDAFAEAQRVEGARDGLATFLEQQPGEKLHQESATSAEASPEEAQTILDETSRRLEKPPAIAEAPFSLEREVAERPAVEGDLFTSGRDELAAFLNEGDKHAIGTGEQPIGDLPEHLGADAPRESPTLAEADRGDRAVELPPTPDAEPGPAPEEAAAPGRAPAADAPVTPTFTREQIQREVRRIAAELETFPFIEHTWNDLSHETGVRGNAAGGHMQLVPGSGGAPVYQDILKAGGRGTRREVHRATQRVLEGGGRPTKNTRAIEEIATARLRGDGDISRPWLPPEAGDTPVTDDALRHLEDWFDEQRRSGGRYALPSRKGGGTDLQSTIVPGAKEFAEQDLGPAMKKAGETIARAADDVARTFASTSRGEEAQTVGGILRARTAELAHRTARAEHALATFGRMFDRLPAEANFKFIDDIEHGADTEVPELQPVQRMLRRMLDERRREVQARGRLQQVIADYFPHIWKQPSEAGNWLRSLFGKRPLQGPKNFLKQRSIGTIAEGRALGLEPVSNNPVTLTLLKIREMDKWITGHDALEDMKAAGVAKYVPVGVEAPRGWTRINDPIGTVYGNPNVPVHEALDEAVFEGLQQLATDLGITHTRSTRLKGGPRGAWGLSHQGESRIQTRTGGPESVLAHEIGHQIDEKFGLWNRLQSLERQYKAQGYENWSLNRELRAVTDLTWEGKPNVPESFLRYVRKKPEKIANMVEAYVHAPEKFKAAAPNVFNVFDELVDTTPALQQLREIKPSLRLTARADSTRVGGMIVNGHWWAPEQGAHVLNQHLSPGLAGNALFDVYRAAGNNITSVKLGLSAFHAMVESMNSVLSKAALSLEYATPRRLGGQGAPGLAMKKGGEILVAPFIDYLRGSKALTEYFTKDPSGDVTRSVVDQIIQGGGRIKRDEFYRSNAAKAFTEALRSGNYPGAAIRAPFAALEKTAAPIMDHLVPRLKLGAFLDLAQLETRRLPNDATPADIQAAYGRAWDSVDNRFGELVYDNLFWPKWVKDVGQITLRALGWQVGTARELGGAAVDTAKYAKDLGTGKTPEVTHRMAYATALASVGTAFAGALYQYLHTGTLPQDARDYVFPKTGEKGPDGQELRAKLPTYAADVYEFTHDPAHTAANKVSDLTSGLIEIAENRDRRGVEIRNPDASVGDQAKELGTYALEKFGTPIGIDQARRDQSSTRKVENLFGIGNAPAAVGRSKAEQLVYDFTKSSDTRTLEQEERRQLRADIRRDVREGKTAEARALAKGGKLSPRAAEQAAKAARLTALQAGFKKLTLDQALKVYDAATPDERATLRSLLDGKVQRARDLAPDSIPELKRRVKAAAALPYSRRTSSEVPAAAAQ